MLLRDQCGVNVRQVKSIGSPYDIFRKSSISNDIVLLNGGYFGRTKKGNPTPIGLVRSNGKRLNSIIPWKSGGFLVSSKNKSDILLASTKIKSLSKWDNAIQSKPILISNNKLDVRKNKRDSHFNRTAIAITEGGGIYIVGVFESFGQALTLYDFSNLMIEMAKSRKINITKALNMDGGPGAHIYIPSNNTNFGDSGATYVPNIISISDCQ